MAENKVLGVVVWEWLNEYGHWRPYQQHVSDFIETKHLVRERDPSKQQDTAVSLSQADPSLTQYSVNLKCLFQVRNDFGTCRPIRRQIYSEDHPASHGIIWRWASDDNGHRRWHNYDYETMIVIEEAHRTQIPSLDLSRTNSIMPYTLDLTNMRQIRNETGFIRKIERVVTSQRYMTCSLTECNNATSSLSTGSVSGSNQSTASQQTSVLSGARALISSTGPQGSISAPSAQWSISAPSAQVMISAQSAPAVLSASSAPTMISGSTGLSTPSGSSQHLAAVNDSNLATLTLSNTSRKSSGANLNAPLFGSTNSSFVQDGKSKSKKKSFSSGASATARPAAIVRPVTRSRTSARSSHTGSSPGHSYSNPPSGLSQGLASSTPAAGSAILGQVAPLAGTHILPGTGLYANTTNFTPGAGGMHTAPSTNFTPGAGGMHTSPGTNFTLGAGGMHTSPGTNFTPGAGGMLSSPGTNFTPGAGGMHTSPGTNFTLGAGGMHTAPSTNFTPGAGGMLSSPGTNFTPGAGGMHTSPGKNFTPGAGGMHTAPATLVHPVVNIFPHQPTQSGSAFVGMSGVSGSASHGGSVTTHLSNQLANHFTRSSSPPRKRQKTVYNNQDRVDQSFDDVLKTYTNIVTSPSDNEDCCICCESLASNDQDSSDVYELGKCKHMFHKICLGAMYTSGNQDGSLQCPICKTIHGKKCGDCPPGRMDYGVIPHRLPGHDDCDTIQIVYTVYPGVQPGAQGNLSTRYWVTGFPRTCFLPNSEKGKKILRLLIEAWKRRLTFTIGTSVTTGRVDTVVWNEIHHKTELGSNRSGHGYPDPNYLDNVLAELAAQGVTDTTE